LLRLKGGGGNTPEGTEQIGTERKMYMEANDTGNHIGSGALQGKRESVYLPMALEWRALWGRGGQATVKGSISVSDPSIGGSGKKGQSNSPPE